MMRQHCDRCDALVDGHQTWVETTFMHPDDALDTVRTSIWHIVIHAGGQVPVFCRACRISILEAYVHNLKEKRP